MAAVAKLLLALLTAIPAILRTWREWVRMQAKAKADQQHAANENAIRERFDPVAPAGGVPEPAGGQPRAAASGAPAIPGRSGGGA